MALRRFRIFLILLSWLFLTIVAEKDCSVVLQKDISYDTTTLGKSERKAYLIISRVL
jgi:hypothetical protein